MGCAATIPTLLYSYEYDGGSDRTVLMKTPEHEMYSIYDEYHRMINSVSKIDGGIHPSTYNAKGQLKSTLPGGYRLIITMIIMVTLYHFRC